MSGAAAGESRRSDLAICRRLLRESRGYRTHLIAIFLLSLSAAPIALLLPIPLRVVVDSVIGTAPLPSFLQPLIPDAVARSTGLLLIACAVLLVLFTLLERLEGFVSWLLQLYTGERLVLDFRARLFEHVQRMSLLYHDRAGTADSLYRIQYDAPAVQYVIVSGLIPLFTSVVTVLAMLYVIMQINVSLAAVAILVVPALFLLTEVYRRRIRGRWNHVKEQESRALGVVQEVLASLRVVKAFAQEQRERDRFAGASFHVLWAQLRVVMAEAGFGLAVAMTLAVGTAMILYLGAHAHRAGEITLGQLLLVMAYLTQLYRPLENISRKIASMQSSFAGAERVFALLDHGTEVPQRADATPLQRAAGHVVFDNVSFAYENGRPVLQDVCLEVPPGTRVGIMGRTGAGKNIVLQEPVLFSTTIAENIAYGRPDATRERIVAAAKAANAHEFITAMPGGYDTILGERGMTLSGGERQRVSLARAFLKDAPILILDEPTSSVDIASEATIMEATQRLMRGRTTFMIAHRLSTLEKCDLLIRVEAGRVSVVPRVEPEVSVPLEGALA